MPENPNPFSTPNHGSEFKETDATKLTAVLDQQYVAASRLAIAGKLSQARAIYLELANQTASPAFRATIQNDLGTLSALEGDFAFARQSYRAALEICPQCTVAIANLSRLDIDQKESGSEKKLNGSTDLPALRQTKVAIVSTLFNWPSTGGGTIHTAETGKFLGLAGYEVRHFFSRFEEWGIGRTEQEPMTPCEVLVFDANSWNTSEIQRRFRQAVDAFSPDFVIVTDSWNFKPLLAEAMQGYRYFLRLAAQECLCPLNNVRLLVDDLGTISACPRHQLATPDTCRKCVGDRERQSGSLHQAERELSEYGTAEYDRKLRESFARAEAVLVVNPLIAAMVSPYAKRVCVVPSGFDSSRFEWAVTESEKSNTRGDRVKLLFAGLTNEYMKGFHILRTACQKLWLKRRDFELVVTCDPPELSDDFCRYIGWQTQERLPHEIRAADILVFPTIAEEALGRSAVEAMAAGRPVIASRIGGLQFTVTDEVTGLLFEPGNSDDLVKKVERLLDSHELRRRLGESGRRKFESEFTWDVILEKHYRQLLGPPNRPSEIDMA